MAGSDGTARLSWRNVAGWRLRRHHLDRPAPRGEMSRVVGDICGLHAQLMSSAELTLSARVPDLAPDAVQRALWEERSLVKTWSMRGTLHVFPASEFPVWQAARAALKPRVEDRAWLRYFGVTREDMDGLLAAIAEALDGRMLTREELASEVSRLTGSEELGGKLRESWGALLKPAADLGLVCFAPSIGQNVRFTRPDRWLGPWAPVDPADASLEVTRRFLAAGGPATRDDVARWWGTTPAHALSLIRRLGDQAVEVEVEGTRAWFLRPHLTEASEASPPPVVRLLPAFDQYVVAATRHAAHLLPGPFKERVYRSQGWLSPVLLVEGRMDGLWAHERKGSRLEVRVEPFVPLPPWAADAVETEAERLAAFLGGRLELEVRAPA